MQAKVIYTEYLKKFSCIGPDCTDSCCIGWKIEIDKKTYLRYKSKRNKSEFNNFIISNVKKNRNRTSASNYAVALQDDKGRCKFLDDDSLCMIHKNEGHDALCGVCSTHPRFYYMINKKIIGCGHLSCPEVARLALLDEDGIKLIDEKIEVNAEAMFFVVDYNIHHKNYFISKNFYDIFNTSINIVQNRLFSIEKRLMLLGVFSNKMALSSSTDIENEIAKFNNEDILNLYANEFENIKSRYYTQLQTVLSISRLGIENNEALKYKLKASDNIVADFDSDEKIIDNYINKGLHFYKNLCIQKEYILENYIVNTLIESKFPLIESYDDTMNDIFLSYIRMVIEFVMLRTVIAGILIGEPDLDNDILIDIIQHHSREMMHNPNLVNDIAEVLIEEGTYSLAGAVLLINI